MGDRTANRAAAARLNMPGPWQASATSLSFSASAGQQQRPLSHSGADRHGSGRGVDLIQLLSRMMSIRTFGFARRVFSIGISDWPPGDDLRVAPLRPRPRGLPDCSART